MALSFNACSTEFGGCSIWGVEIVTNLLSLVLHLDKYLNIVIENFGVVTYLILFLIIFAETGFVVTPFLPGDSLLFASGAFAAVGVLNPFLLFMILFAAAVLGDSVNYWFGSFVGPKAIDSKRVARFIKREYITKTEKFYEKYGAKTIVLARFVPIVRTFAPFVAGVGTMQYRTFITYNIVGGFAWVAIFVWGGYFFGNIPVVKEHFSFVIIAIILISVLPMAIEYIKHKKAGVPL